MIKPFPYPLNIGTDIVHLPRITRLLTHRPNYLNRFTRRILCDSEQEDFRTRFRITNINTNEYSNHNVVSVSPDMIRWLAGRFAAKEAAKKAAPLGAAGVGWKDVLVRVPRDDEDNSGVALGSGRPEIVYLDRPMTGDAQWVQAEARGAKGRVGKLSISHDGDYVVATVLAVG
ncbi:hypothetical protein MPDQ_004834 [Monascus purpureus]|uniref:4'-phosphopantetheinyl transferase domain-containing protein n=1 Tax=Monascus purpureus TaxID=5098 RepID=A0A507QKU8_MONPU|nr:hypothetical protein MPDQ_004834 [Monascus purpureus]BDD56027.1 hypothetical protein MAP00_001510 [Monascus purpureus]